MEEEAVRVAVRVRPQNERELKLGKPNCVRYTVEEKGVKVYVNEGPRESGPFLYDFAFENETQEVVFAAVGTPLIDAALAGRNICLFAYGQTGSGKTHTMVGKDDAPGMIPRIIGSLFDRASTLPPPVEGAVTVPMLSLSVIEVYCEQLNNLLVGGPQKEVQAKFAAGGGYRADVEPIPCFTVADAMANINRAFANRTIKAHKLNKESSRGHTLYIVDFAAVSTIDDGKKEVRRISVRVNLVDLAGSERTTKAGTDSGEMLEEANAINKSLLALGECIKVLSEAKGDKPVFMNSMLTKLLAASMMEGKMLMVAALSPSQDNFQETLSTLRFAERVKKVKIKSRVNIETDPLAQAKKARDELAAELARRLAEYVPREVSPEEAAQRAAEREALVKRMEEEREEYEKRIQSLQESQKDRVSRALRITGELVSSLEASGVTGGVVTVPHLKNMEADPRLSETLTFKVQPGTTVHVGRADDSDFVFGGAGIRSHHCDLSCDAETHRLFVTPAAGARVLVDGRAVSDKTELVHHSRLWLGVSLAFRVVIPRRAAPFPGKAADWVPDFTFAEAEVAEDSANIADSAAATALDPSVVRQLREVRLITAQANSCAAELGRRVRYAPRIVAALPEVDTSAPPPPSHKPGEETAAGGCSATAGAPPAATTVMIAATLVEGGEVLLTLPEFETLASQISRVWEAAQSMPSYATPRDDADGRVHSFIPASAMAAALSAAGVARDPFDLGGLVAHIGSTVLCLRALANGTFVRVTVPLLMPGTTNGGSVTVSVAPLGARGKSSGARGELGVWDDDELDDDPFEDDPATLLTRQGFYATGEDKGRAAIAFEVRVERARIGPPPVDHDHDHAEKEKGGGDSLRPKVVREPLYRGVVVSCSLPGAEGGPFRTEHGVQVEGGDADEVAWSAVWRVVLPMTPDALALLQTGRVPLQVAGTLNTAEAQRRAMHGGADGHSEQFVAQLAARIRAMEKEIGDSQRVSKTLDREIAAANAELAMVTSRSR